MPAPTRWSSDGPADVSLAQVGMGRATPQKLIAHREFRTIQNRPKDVMRRLMP